RDFNDFRCLRRFLQRSEELDRVDVLREDLRLEQAHAQMRLRSILDAERETQQQLHDKLMTERMLDGLEEEMMGASSPSTSELLAKSDPQEASVLEEVDVPAYASKPQRPQ
ncbi:hypothetical protein DUNSADRAFT_2604, partial [Dunaliella salina]